MGLRYEELDWQQTPMGEISLRRRLEPAVGEEVYEVKLGEEFLMTSLFTASERALARLGLAETPGEALDVLVGGLGLGYTAATALEDPRVATLTVVDAVAAVIDWHRRDLLPDTSGLAQDPRTRLLQGDFFALVADEPPLVPDARASYDAILLDIDHTPRHTLSPGHASFYTVEGLVAMKRHLAPDGVFALWSDDPPDEDFMAVLGQAFTTIRPEVVSFANPITRGESACTVYVARD
jgi:spermidine synthase